MNQQSEALKLHQKLKGKLAVQSKISLKSKDMLSLLYTPGVADVVKYITRHKKSIFDLTIKKNSLAVITDGSAVLGLGNVGPEAALPVMEGKCAIFKEFAGIDAYPLCLRTQNVAEIVTTVKNISPGFAAINLEDIAAPRCFEIESKLQDIGIPVVHDDQHATAIAVLAGLINASKVVKKDLTTSKIVIVGSGAAGIAIAKLLSFLNIKKIIMVDKIGIICRARKNLPSYKKELLTFTNPGNLQGDIASSVVKSDILIGVSTKNIFTQKHIRLMNNNPVIFALANPDPEITPDKAKQYGAKIIATGRSDYPNQINNALVFPGFFKGLLKSGKTAVTNEMKVKAAYALAGLIKKPKADYFIPSIFDKRVVPAISNCF